MFLRLLLAITILTLCCLNSGLPIAERWPLMDPNEIIFVVVTYLIFVLKLIPVAMEGRSPFPGKGLLKFFNAFKFLNLSFLACQFVLHVADEGLFPQKYKNDEFSQYVTAILYWKFLTTKVLDLFDTMLISVRKKKDQVTFLHVYHRVCMVVTTWVCLKYDPSYHWTLIALVDCLINTFSSAYYCLAVLGPRFKRYLWWKKYLVMMQMMEFFSMIVLTTIRASVSECPLHVSSYCMGLLYLILFFSFLNEKTKGRGDSVHPTCIKD